MYYATKRTIKNGAAVTPSNYSYTNPSDGEKQFHLLCANAITNSEQCETIAVEWGTVEQGAVERRVWNYQITPPEPEPEPEPEIEEPTEEPTGETEG